MTPAPAKDLPVRATLKELSPCEKQLAVEVPAESVREEEEAVYQDLKRVARVPGFRVGHAPADLIQRYHGDKAREELIQRLVNRSLDAALQEKGPLDLVGRPVISELKLAAGGGTLTYVAKLEIAPRVPVGRYKKLRLTRRSAAITESAVEQVVKQLQEHHGELRPILENRAVRAGDFLLADLTQTPAGKAPEKKRDLLLSVAPEPEKESEGISKDLLGMTPGQKREIHLKDSTALVVELKAIKEKVLPPVDDALAQAAGSFQTLADLKAQVRKELTERAQAGQRQALESQALEELLASWSFEVPPSLVASQAKRLLKENTLELISRGVKPEEVEGRSKLLTEQAKRDALKDVRIFFILRAVAKAEGLSATEEELNQRVEALSKRLNLTPEEVRKDLEARELLEGMAWSITRAKILDLIIREAEIEEEKIR
ncbi:MAG: trigger factor [Candidatus Omnitrophica bacterium]|nr:trigger factor [Candidatus Omnitrophota bacterium]